MRNAQKLMITSAFLVVLIVVNAVVYYALHAKSSQPRATEAKAHYIVIGKNTEEPFWALLRQGVEAAADNLGIDVEFLAPNENSAYYEEQMLRLAINARVDGIITHVADEEIFRTLIDKAAGEGIPVVTLYNDAFFSKRIAHIGIDNYQRGWLTGKAVVDSIGESGSVVLIIGATEGYKYDSDQYEFIKGLNNYLTPFQRMLIVKEQYSYSSFISADAITRNLFNYYNAISAIVVTNAADALGAAECLVSLGKVGETRLICADENTKVLERIKEGVITAAITVDAFEMGVKCIDLLHNHLSGIPQEVIHSTKMQVITADNVHDYEQNRHSFEIAR